MILFETMSTVVLYTVLTVIILISLGARSNPFAVGMEFVRQLLSSKKFLLHFGLVLIILFFNKIELVVEANLVQKTDYTRLFYLLERGFVSGIQNMFEHALLTPFLAFMYVVVFQSMLIASIGIYSFQQNKTMFYAICYAIIINYLIAIPFYLFVPVLEAWAYDPNVRFIMLDAFPAFESQYREMSGLDNCFPSLHTSISVTMAMLALRSGNKLWAWFCGISAGIIIFSIFYLGIHWMIDMFGGIALGLFASAAGMKLSVSAQGFPMRTLRSPVARSLQRSIQRDHSG